MKDFFDKLGKILFLIIVATIPVQLGKHFWPDFSYIAGVRVDFLSPTIFLQDFVIFAFVVLSIVRLLTFKKLPPKKLTFALCLFLVGVLISTVSTLRPALSFWFLFKILEFSAFAVSVAILDFSNVYKKTVWIFVATSTLVTFLAILQFWQQGSAGLWIFGERSFSLTTPGIAKIDLQGVSMLRPYATFPHPNVLGGFLVFSLLLITFSNICRLAKFLVLPLLIFGIFLTFSRSAWLGLSFGIILAYFVNFSWRKTLIGTLLAAAVFLLLISAFPQNPVSERFLQLSGTDLHSLTLRAKLTKSAIGMFVESPLTGTGFGNFLVELPRFWKFEEDVRFLQPVHNVPLLVLAETGVVGGLAFFYLILISLNQLFKNLKRGFVFLLPIWAMIVLVSSLDHYFWTLQQGQILFWLTLGLTFQKL